ncbi:hypothetical protein [Lacticaseibacillus kribbianus]|uniref:hypothetical protein n=1 Tax=Lacticaseibacillus kribbianus TaxID=2926292 RepID=UPI001CD6A732|nr:hypothetical protein [Lacticaseibacillus kribbianus]
MKLDRTSALNNQQWTVAHHFDHIRQGHPFARQIAVQYELAHTDFRVLQLILQLEGQPALYADFTAAYEKVQAFEWPFIAGGPEAFSARFGTRLADYHQAVAAFDTVCEQVAEG